jgi:hypothetical protein
MTKVKEVNHVAIFTRAAGNPPVVKPEMKIALGKKRQK